MKYVFTVVISFMFFFSDIIFAQTYSNATHVRTPRNSTVTDVQVLTSADVSYNSAQLAALASDLNMNYNGAYIVDVPSCRYNCHAYAWHVSEGGDRVWLGYNTATAEDIYWNDKSYREVSEDKATKVSYHQTGNHSAIRLSSRVYRSKWGAGALVSHGPNDVPISYQPLMPKKYYVKNYCLLGGVSLENQSISTSKIVDGRGIYIKNITLNTGKTLIINFCGDINIEGDLELKNGTELQLNSKK